MSVLWWPSVATRGSPPASCLSTKIGCENCTACAFAGNAASSATDRTRLRRLISPLRRWTSHWYGALHYALYRLEVAARQLQVARRGAPLDVAGLARADDRHVHA